MHIVTGLSKELLPPVSEAEAGGQWEGGGRFSSWSVSLCMGVDGGYNHCAVDGSFEGTFEG